VANKDYIARLQQVIFHLHHSDSVWIETVPVHEVFNGKTLWRGNVEVFTLSSHPKAKRAYGWSHVAGNDDTDERFVTVLEIPPVISAETAVKVAVASEIKQERKKEKL
jgi:hypothetical protein